MSDQSERPAFGLDGRKAAALDSIVDRVARAIFDETYNPAHLSLDAAWSVGDIKDFYRNAARAAICSMRIPTRVMVLAADDVGIDQDPTDYWLAMIDAALSD